MSSKSLKIKRNNGIEFPILFNKKNKYFYSNNYHLSIAFTKFLPKKIQKINFLGKIEKMAWLFFLTNIDRYEDKIIDKGKEDFNLDGVKEIVSEINKSVIKKELDFSFQNYYYIKSNLIKFFRKINLKNTNKYLRNLEIYGKVEPDKFDKNMTIKDIESMKFDYRIKINNLNYDKIDIDGIEMVLYK